MFKHCCEDPNTLYITLFGKRFVFRTNYKNGKYAGWYRV